MKKNPAIDAFIVCDDIRHEDNKKAILIGVYSSKVVFQQKLPRKLPKLCFLYMIEKGALKKGNIKWGINSPSGKNIFRSPEQELPIPTGEPANIELEITDLVIKEPGEYRIKLWFNNRIWDERIVIFEAP